jgi:hypothetical protein
MQRGLLTLRVLAAVESAEGGDADRIVQGDRRAVCAAGFEVCRLVAELA